ncbi:MAG: hypothetical protein KC478_04325 [Bacteriovoracaceae bacterium]|nr:hypothetical protein [Bacteriovoracaceae bacterium]
MGFTDIAQNYTKSNLESFTNSGVGHIGGFVGQVSQSAGSIDISEAFSTGYVSASGTNYVGGFAGSNSGGDLINIYSKSDVVAMPAATFAASLIGSGSAGSIQHSFASGTSTGGNCINGSSATTGFNFCADGNAGSANYAGTITSKSATDILALTSTDFNSDPAWTVNSNLGFSEKITALGEEFTGSFFDPIVITTVSQWNAIGDNQDLMKKTYQLGSNISFSNADCGAGFNPIGSSLSPFHGEFKGNDYTISDINCSETAGGEPLGLFRSVAATSQSSGGSIVDYDLFDYSNSKALYVDNVHFDTDQGEIGIVAGKVIDDGSAGSGHEHRFATNFSKIHVVNSSVTQNGNFSIGGLIGDMNLSNEESGVTLSSFSNGDIVHTGTNGKTGGLFGFIHGTLAVSDTRLLDFAVLNFEGTIDSSSNDGTGGLVGNLTHNKMEMAYASVDSIDITGASRTGGAVGYIYGGMIRDSFVKADVTGNDFVGGFSGTANGSAVKLKGNYTEGTAHCLNAACTVAGFSSEAATSPEMQQNIANMTTSCATTCTQNEFGPATFVLGGGTLNFQVGGTDSGGLIKAVTPLELLDQNAMDIYGLVQGDPWIHFDGDAPRLFWEIYPEFLYNN